MLTDAEAAADLKNRIGWMYLIDATFWASMVMLDKRNGLDNVESAQRIGYGAGNLFRYAEEAVDHGLPAEGVGRVVANALGGQPLAVRIAIANDRMVRSAANR